MFEFPIQPYWDEQLRPRDRDLLIADGKWRRYYRRCAEMTDTAWFVPHPPDVTAVTYAATGEFPHYQERLGNLAFPLTTGSGHSKWLKWKLPATNSGDVRNFYVPSLDSAIPWQELASLVATIGGKHDPDRGQFAYIDTGFTTSMSASTTSPASNVDDYLPAPNLHDLSTSPIVVGVFCLLSREISKMKEAGLLPPSLFGFDEDRRQTFAAQIHEDNCIEAIRFNLTNDQFMTGIHVDKSNDPVHRGFLSIAKTVKVAEVETPMRLGIVCYTRRSISDYMDRSKTYGTLIQDMLVWYRALPATLLHNAVFPDSDPQTKNNMERNLFCFLPMSNLPCGMDPGRYLSSSVHALTCAILKLRLNFKQVVSLLVAFSKMAFSPSFFVAAIHLTIRDPSHVMAAMRNVKGRRAANCYSCGRYILCLMKELRSSKDIHHWKNTEPGEGGPVRAASVPGMRFSAYQAGKESAPPPTEAQWRCECEAVAGALLDSWRADKNISSSPKSAARLSRERKAFKCLHGNLVKAVKKMGPLVATHFTAFAAIIGVAPFWVLDHAEPPGTSSHVVGRLQERYNVSLRTREKQERLMTAWIPEA